MTSAAAILKFSENFSLYFMITIFILGLIGNTMNILVFTMVKLFRSNQCVFYLLVETCFNNLQLIIILIIVLIAATMPVDPAASSLIWCKLRNILPQFFRLMTTAMICLNAFDQYLSTNHRAELRRLSTLRMACYLTIGSAILWIIHCIPYAIFIDIVRSTTCTNVSATLIRYYSYFYYPVLHGLLPIFLAGFFSLLAYRNVRRIVRRQVPVVRRRLDRQLTAMIFVRVIIFIILLLPYTIYRIYTLNITISRQDTDRYAMDRLIFSLTTSMSNLNSAISFYGFFLTSARYRRQVKNYLIKKIWKNLTMRCSRDQNEIHPSGAASNICSDLD